MPTTGVALVIFQRPGLQAFCFLGTEKQGEVIIERVVQGNRCGSQPFACCCCRGHMDRSSQNGCKKAAKATAAVCGMFMKIIKLSNPNGQGILDTRDEEDTFCNNSVEKYKC
jgi:hypothetical protein